MKQVAVILFTLLLIVAQTFAVAVPVSSRHCAERTGCCCGKGCVCQVDQGENDVPPFETAVPVSGPIQFIIVPAGRVLIEIAPVADSLSIPFVGTPWLAGSQPLFRLNCAMRI